MDKAAYRHSNARARYGKNTRRPSKNKADNNYAETVLLQCIISSAVLLILLVVCLVKTDFTNNLRYSLKTAITAQTTLEDLKNSVSIFNKKPASTEPLKDTGEPALVTESPGTENTQSNTEPTDSSANPATFRIDEDILEEISSQKDPYSIKK